MEKLRVLIVDDETGMLDGIKRILDHFEIKQDDFDTVVRLECETAESDTKALQMLRNNEYELLLLDHKLQNMTGLDILEINKAEKRDILTVMITAFASIEVAVSATRQGAFDFIAKPFTPAELKSSVEKAVNHIFFTKKAKKLEEEKRAQRFEFISILAHELKSPLAAVEGYLNIMDAKIKGDSLSAYENMIDRSISRIEGMRKLIMDLLDLTRIESGRKKRIYENIAVKDIIDESLENIEENIKKLNLKVFVNMEENLEFYADKDDLRIIFNNLLSNAAKYNKKGGKIELNIRKTGNKLTIKCSDTGIGINEKDLNRLFEEFSRIKNEKTRNITGSGLGLSILKKTVNTYGGKINVQSRENEGTTFITELSEPQTL